MKSEAHSELVAVVAEDILAYLLENSAAADTPHGISRWWIADGRAKVDVAIVEQALQMLVARGQIGIRMMASGTTLYFGLGASTRGGM